MPNAIRDYVIRQAKYGPAWVEIEFVREERDGPYEMRRRINHRYIPQATWKRITKHYARPTKTRIASPRESLLLAMQQDVRKPRQKEESYLS